jgi:hypothetical protein
MTGEETPLLRGDSVVSSFAGAFGAKLKETRLTAILGYLIALEPKLFCDEFGIPGEIESTVPALFSFATNAGAITIRCSQPV